MEYHEPVLLHESIDGLAIRPDGVYVDVTFGGGGHSREVLRRLNSEGRLIGFDQDTDAALNCPDDERFIFVQQNFRFLSNFLRYHGYPLVDGVLADLGVSSHHFDEAARGFSFRFEGDLDMRMNKNVQFSAKDLLNTYDERKLMWLFSEYGEVENSFKLAKHIVAARANQPFESIQQFKSAISACIPANAEHKYLAKVFQAIRIEVNHEMDYLQQMLTQVVAVLKPGGRLSVITYHSLEDRLVKNFIKAGNFEGKLEKDLFGNIKAPLAAINKKVIIPTDDEIARNNRARSAKLRIAEKI